MLGELTDVRPEERRGALAAFLALFGILAGHTLLETARDALFLARLPASQLPWVYLTIAGIAVLISQSPWRGLGGPVARYGLSLLLLLCAGVTLAFYGLTSLGGNAWSLRALYVWSGLVGTLTGLQFWLVLGELYTVTQAKRLYKLVGLGSVLGAVAGSVAARSLAESLPTPSLVLAAALTFAATGLGPALLLRAPEAPAKAAPALGGSLRQSLELLRANPYVRGLSGLVLISTVALTLTDYVFKSAVARHVPAESLGGFFATVYMVLNLLALLAQLALTGWLLRVLGLNRALWVLPTLLLLGAGGVAFGGGVVAALLMKGADGSLRYSLHRTGLELLQVPIPDGVRHRAKPFIDVVGQRGGQAVASLFILSDGVMRRGDVTLAALAAALCVLWVLLAADLKRHYLEMFRGALREGSIALRSDLPDLDLGSLETLFAALNSRNDAEVIGALDLLARERRARLIPALILYHPSPAVLGKALAIFERSGRDDFVPIADLLLEHQDPEVRSAALRARTNARHEESVLRAAVADRSPLVRSTALVGLMAGGWSVEEARRSLAALLEDPAPEARLALARAILRQPSPVFEDLLLQLAESTSAEVLQQAAKAMGAVKSALFLEALVRMLPAHEVRRAAQEALLAHGGQALEYLAAALADTDLPHEIRRHLPRTIASFPPREAAPLLLRRLLAETDGMVRFKIIRGLGHIAANHPEVAFDAAIVKEATARTLGACFRLTHWRSVLEGGAAQRPHRLTQGHRLLVALLRDKEAQAVERLLRLLGLRHRREDFRNIHRGLRSPRPAARASSRELLENVLRAPLRGSVLALLDDAPDRQRLLGAPPFYTPGDLDYEAVLELLLSARSESLSCLVAYHVAELGLRGFRRRLDDIDVSRAGLFLARVVERARARLAEVEGVAHA